ncbi:MAG TPA: glycosyltransferase family 4 protein [Bryobacteraceae bacterium]|jgi:glycosyltransferase involved in cell wall biosynthesis
MPLTKNAKVLVVGPGGGIRGGIDSVIDAHMRTATWQEYKCELIPTYADASAARKLWAAARAYLRFFGTIWTAGLIHIHLAGESSLIRKLPFVAMAKLWRKPLLVHVHAASPESLFDRTPSWAVRFTLLSADRVIALSPLWASSIKDKCPDAKIAVIPNPAVMPASTPGADDREPTVLYVGKLESRKGYADLIRSAAEVVRVLPGARFVFAGHGEVKEARELAASLGLDSSIECLGWVSREALPALLNRAAVFCLPSYNEGVPMCLIEAMSYGVPVVMTPVGGIPDLIQSGENGILVTPGDIGGFSRAIIELLKNEDGIRARFSTAARDTVRVRCGLEHVAALLADLYRELGEFRNDPPASARHLAVVSGGKSRS